MLEKKEPNRINFFPLLEKNGVCDGVKRGRIGKKKVLAGNFNKHSQIEQGISSHYPNIL